ncbi:MAG: flavoprotein [Pirellulales bacterium]
MSSIPNQNNHLPIVVGITGASGAVYAARTLQWLLEEARRVHLVISPDGLTVIRQELGYDGSVTLDSIAELFAAAGKLMSGNSAVEASKFASRAVAAVSAGHLKIHKSDDYFSPIASGSYRTAGMVVCPCSGTSLAAIAHSSGRNLIHRAAEVHLKEPPQADFSPSGNASEHSAN